MGKNRKRSFVRKTLRLIFLAGVGFLLLSIGITLIYRFIPPPITPLMVIRLVEQKKSGEPLRLRKDWVRMKKISPYLPHAVIASEDQNFLEHKGFDFKSIRKAREYNKKGKRIRGASTISQQTAKNVFLWPKRSWLRKGLEVYFTMLIEGLWGKKRIMEVYLNVIETGNGIYGVDKASEIYFNRSAGDLSKPQAALIAVCLPNPRKFNPAKPSTYIYGRQAWAMRQMSYIDGALYQKEKFYKESKKKE
jgi:monofunctional glycosyltransferase